MKGEYFNMMKKLTALILALLLVLPAISLAEDNVLNILSWEGYVDADTIATFEAETGIETRATIIGHTQRGGAPTIRDRVMATKMADYAVDLLANGIGNRVVTCNNNIIGDKDIFEALQMTKDLDMALFDMAERLAI